MSLDLQRLRSKLDSLKNPKKAKYEKKTWPLETAKAGDLKTIRLIQYPYGDDPFVELFFHYGIGSGPSILCPRLNSGKTCPICELAFSFRGSTDAQAKAEAKKLYPKQRIYAAMIDRADATPVVRYWGFGKEVYQNLIEKLLSEDYATFLDPVHGLDAEIKFDRRGDSSFVIPNLTFKRRESPLADSDAKIKELISSVPEIEEVFKPLTSTQIEERLTSFLNLTDKDGGETTRGVSTKSDEDEEEVSHGPATKDLDEAFEEALRDI